jgi:hypothetical protein
MLGMKRPSPSNDNSRNRPPMPRYTWDIYRAAARARWLGQIVAGDANEATIGLQTDIKKLIAMRSGPHRYHLTFDDDGGIRDALQE